MESILRQRSFNVGGNTELYVARYTSLLSIPRVVNQLITGDLTMSTGWIQIEAIPYSINYNEELTEEAPGPVLQVSVTFRLPNNDPLQSNKLKLLRSERLVVMLRDTAGQLRLVGNRLEYLKQQRLEDTGALPYDLNHNEVMLSGRFKSEPPMYTGSLSVNTSVSLFRHPRFNLGGNIALYIIEQRFIKYIPRSVDGYVDPDRVEVEGEVTYERIEIEGGWLPIDVTPYSIRYDEEEVDDPAGPVIGVNLSFQLSKDEAELQHKLKLIKSRKIAALLESPGGIYRIVGNVTEYLRYARGYTTGTAAADHNRHAITLTGRLKAGSVFYQTDEPVDISLTDEFVESEFNVEEFL